MLATIDREAAFTEFRAGFRRSWRGNLWRNYEGDTITVFRTDRGYQWCISTPDEVRYGAKPHETEQDALIALADAMLVFVPFTKED